MRIAPALVIRMQPSRSPPICVLKSNGVAAKEVSTTGDQKLHHFEDHEAGVEGSTVQVTLRMLDIGNPTHAVRTP
jgi:hypothetical protein